MGKHNENINESYSLSQGANAFPEVIVFDLDYTLWPFWVDAHISGGPFQTQPTGKVIDRSGFEVCLYEDVASILEFVRCYLPTTKMALASRTPKPDWAAEIIEKLEVTPDLQKVELLKAKFGLDIKVREPSEDKKAFKAYFTSIQLFPGNKLPHFRAIYKDTEVEFKNMIFYDDESRNIRDVSTLGVTSVIVRNGLSISLFLESINNFINKK